MNALPEETTPPLPTGAALLGLNSEQFVRAATGKVIIDRMGGPRGAMRAYREIFRTGRTDIPGLSFEPPRLAHVQSEESPEGTVVKFVTRLEGELPGGVAPEVESVLIPMIGSAGKLKYTLCVSSQVGGMWSALMSATWSSWAWVNRWTTGTTCSRLFRC
jgi:hypothetical protein